MNGYIKWCASSGILFRQEKDCPQSIAHSPVRGEEMEWITDHAYKMKSPYKFQ